MTVSAHSARDLAGTAKDRQRSRAANIGQVELRRGGRVLAGSYLYEGELLVTGWHFHDVHQIEYAIERVKEGGSYVDPRLDRILLSPRATAHVPQLSPREREIMHLMAEGRTAEAIADEISVSVETVRTHVRNVIRKLQARNRVHAIAIALERGEIALDHSAND